MTNWTQIELQNRLREFTLKAETHRARAVQYEAQAASEADDPKKGIYRPSTDRDIYLELAAEEHAKGADYEQRAQAVHDDMMRMQGKTPPDRSMDIASKTDATGSATKSLREMINDQSSVKRDSDAKGGAAIKQTVVHPKDDNLKGDEADKRAAEQARVARALGRMPKPGKYDELTKDTDELVRGRGPKL